MSTKTDISKNQGVNAFCTSQMTPMFLWVLTHLQSFSSVSRKWCKFETLQKFTSICSVLQGHLNLLAKFQICILKTVRMHWKRRQKILVDFIKTVSKSSRRSMYRACRNRRRDQKSMDKVHVGQCQMRKYKA